MEFKQQGKKFSFHTFWLKNGGRWMGLVEVVYGCLFSSNSCWGSITRLLKIWFALLDKVIRFCVSLWGGPDEGVLGHTKVHVFVFVWRLKIGARSWFLNFINGNWINWSDRYMSKLMHFFVCLEAYKWIIFYNLHSLC